MRLPIRTLVAATPTSLAAIGSARALTVYSSVDEEIAKRLLDAFTRDTGVEVQMEFLSSGPALSRIEAEKARPQADVRFGARSDNQIIAKERGLTEPLVPPNAAALPDACKDEDGYGHAIYTKPLAVGVRADILQRRNAPASWEDPKNPAYEGLIQMPSPQSSDTAHAAS